VTLVYVVGGFVIGIVAMLAGVILCLVGLIVTLPAGQLIIYYLQSHLYGQLARTARPSFATPAGDFDLPAFPEEPPSEEPPTPPPSIIE
ncbi:MAG: hypothetical protein D6790_16390, partial [Caldilineae bacterium]